MAQASILITKMEPIITRNNQIKIKWKSGQTLNPIALCTTSSSHLLGSKSLSSPTHSTLPPATYEASLLGWGGPHSTPATLLGRLPLVVASTMSQSLQCTWGFTFTAFCNFLSGPLDRDSYFATHCWTSGFFSETTSIMNHSYL